MVVKSLKLTAALVLLFFAAAQVVRAQKEGKGGRDGEAQAVVFDEDNNPVLQFGNEPASRQRCATFVGRTLLDNQEEAFVAAAAHLHSGFLGRPSLPETGWLYITQSRIVFRVEIGDKSHEFDIKRADLTDKPVKRFVDHLAAIRINLREKLPPSNSSEQKFVFFVFGAKECRVNNPTPYNKFIERAVNDFGGAMAEFKQTAASLTQSGKVGQAPPVVKWLSFYAETMNAPTRNTPPPNKPVGSKPQRGSN